MRVEALFLHWSPYQTDGTASLLRGLPNEKRSALSSPGYPSDQANHPVLRIRTPKRINVAWDSVLGVHT